MEDKTITNKIDPSLALQEGLYSLKEEYSQVKQSAKYQEVFTRSSPLVSICIATVNRSELLIRRSLQSILAQSYKNLEIIIVGDHCIDDTELAVARLKDSRIIFENLPERGPYPRPGISRWQVAGTNAMNRALDLATGDFITHLDDDDQATPNRIEILLKNAQQQRSDFLWHKFYNQQLDGTWISKGSESLESGQVTTSSIFYHRYFRKIKWDVYAFRLNEPGDWNRIRKIKFLYPNSLYINQELLFHFKERQQDKFVAQANERFLDF